jgi:50S ribosomal protein L16 3-hydroxylase
MRVVGGLTARAFLDRHWQKRPLVVRGAFPDFQDPLDPDELAGLACQPEVESRLVLERGRRPWQVVEGPQQERRLRRLPGSHWTLLVQEVDKNVPAVAALRAPFRFLPGWRIDDVMVSFAPEAGTVGPHVDSYDVFLIQGRGRRRWQVASRFDPELRQGLDLRMLRRFQPEQEWVLEPGDLLYVPPGVAHHGVSLEPSLTYSVGFHAPSRAEVVTRWARHRALDPRGAQHYADPDLRPARHPGELTRAAVGRLREMVETSLAARGAEFARFAGELVTEPRGVPPEPRRRKLTAAELARRLRRGALRPCAESRAAFVRGRGGAWLCVDGRSHWLGGAEAPLAVLLSSGRPLRSAELFPWLSEPAVAALLLELVNAGAFEICGDSLHGP